MQHEDSVLNKRPQYKASTKSQGINTISDDHISWEYVVKIGAKGLAKHLGINDAAEFESTLIGLKKIAEKLPSMKASQREKAIATQIEYIKEDYGKYNTKLNRFLESLSSKWLETAAGNDDAEASDSDSANKKQNVISKEDMDTLVTDIVPILQRKFKKLYAKESTQVASPDKRKIIEEALKDISSLFSVHGLAHLANNNQVKALLIKHIT